MTKKQAMPYMKLYTTYLDDIDFIELERAARSLYWDLYLLAWNADAGGDLLNRETGKPLTIRHIALRLRDEAATLEKDLAALSGAGFISRHGDTWRISRYQDEQDNQEAMRNSWSGRQAKHRKKPKEPTEEESQENEDEDQMEEKIIISDNQSNQTELKSHTDVTRDSRGDGMNESQDGLDIIYLYSFPSPTRNKLQAGMHPYLHTMAEVWVSHMGGHITAYPQRIINQALNDGIDPQKIAYMIQTTATHEPANKNGYFAQCIKTLYLQKELAEKSQSANGADIKR